MRILLILTFDFVLDDLNDQNIIDLLPDEEKDAATKLVRQTLREMSDMALNDSNAGNGDFLRENLLEAGKGFRWALRRLIATDFLSDQGLEIIALSVERLAAFIALTRKNLKDTTGIE